MNDDDDVFYTTLKTMPTSEYGTISMFLRGLSIKLSNIRLFFAKQTFWGKFSGRPPENFSPRPGNFSFDVCLTTVHNLCIIPYFWLVHVPPYSLVSCSPHADWRSSRTLLSYWLHSLEEHWPLIRRLIFSFAECFQLSCTVSSHSGNGQTWNQKFAEILYRMWQLNHV